MVTFCFLRVLRPTPSHSLYILRIGKGTYENKIKNFETQFFVSSQNPP
jgi:hypothetical protein